jgi:hypothetical protein
MRNLSIALFATAWLAFGQQSQPPSPSPPKSANNNQGEATGKKGETQKDEGVSDSVSTAINKLTSEVIAWKKQESSAHDKNDMSTDWWTIWSTIVMALATLAIAYLGYRQWRTLQAHHSVMDRQAGYIRDALAQTQASIAQATRASQAMEGIAASMAANVESVRETVRINREIAARQKLITELQGRAYLAILFDSMLPQNSATGVRFQPTLRIENRGGTPAYNIRFTITADVVPFPLRDDFAFALPAEPTGFSSNIAQGLHKVITAVVPRLYPDVEATQIALGFGGQRVIAWGIVSYRDAFNLERFSRFGLTFYAVGGGAKWMSQDTIRNNESD